jgi:O-antigen/teichoic acid export membrane protein
LIAGILSVLFAFTHAMNGQLTLLSEIDQTSLESGTKTIIRYVWHIITAENLIFGVALIFMAFYREREKVRIVAWLIAVVLLTRWFVILIFTLMRDSASLQGVIADTIAILLLVVLLLLGARVKDRVGKTV